MKKYVFESLKFFCAAILCTILSAFATPSWGANCNLIDESQILNANGFSINENGYYNGSFADWLSVRFSFDNAFKENTQYTLSFNGYVSDNAAIFLFNYTDGTQGRCGITATQATDYTCKTEPNKTLSNIATTYGSGPQTVYVKNIQLEEGTTATEYTPYNPLCATCKNGVSPNLFETVDTTSGLYGVTLTSAANGLVTVVGTATGGGGRNTVRLQNFTLPAGTYTVSFSGTKRSQLYLVAGNDSNATNLITDVNGGTFTISESKTLHFGLNLNNGTTYNDSFYIQLEAGSTATPYQPYGCIAPITIATTKYNETAFSPLNTALANAISVVDTVVSNTITQAASIATLQAQKQTRPNDIADDNEKCPAGKKCLLVEDASGVPHWYEIVENAWDLPVGYTQLQYIESTGGRYIDTGLTAGSDTRVLAQYKLNSVGFTSPISVRDENVAGAGFGVGVNGSQQFISDYNGDRKVFTTITPNETDIITVDKNKNVCTITIGGQSETVTNTVSTFTTTNTLPLFAQNSAGTVSSGKYIFYSFKMWDNNTLVRDFVPAKNSSGVVGMYDKVSGEFFENKGTGDFIAGDPVTE